MDGLNRRISICFVAAGLEGGGIERAFTSLANHYDKNGYTVSVILLFKRPHFFSLNEGIRLVEPDADRTSINKYVYAMRMIPYLRRSITILQPDTLISFGEWLNPFVILSTRFLSIPLYVADRMSPAIRLGRLQEFAKRMLYRMAEGVIAQTQHAAVTIANKTGAKNIAVIPNPVNIFQYPTVPKKNIIISVGRLSKEKGHRFLIEAFAKLDAPDWTLSLIGDGDQRNALEAQAAELGVKDRVIFHGHLKNFESLLAEARIFVLPSLLEGFPNALIEAMSVPLPCISSDCVAGPADIIKHNYNGILIKPGDSQQLTQSLRELMNNESLQRKLSAHAFEIRRELQFETIANRYADFITSTIKQL